MDRVHRRRWLRRGAYTALGLGLLGALVLAWMPKPLPVEVVVAARGPMVVRVDEDGVARVKDRYVISAPLAGSLARLELDAGDPVRQGARVASIEPVAPALLDARARASAEARLAQALAAQRQAKAQTERTRSNFDQAVADLDRARRLLAQGAGPREAVEQGEIAERRTRAEMESQAFAVRVADFEVQMARATLDRLPGARQTGRPLLIPSPVDGRVLKVLRQSEGVVTAGTQLLEVGDPGALEVAVDVLTSDASRIAPGAEVTLDRWGGEPLTARVRRVEPSAFTRLSALGVEEQRVNVLVDLASPRALWEALGDGYRVEAHIVVWQGQDVVHVPSSAIFRHGDGWALYRAIDERARLVPVQIGQRTTRDVQVTQGLTGGETVIVHPSDKVKDGVRVKAP